MYFHIDCFVCVKAYAAFTAKHVHVSIAPVDYDNALCMKALRLVMSA